MYIIVENLTRRAGLNCSGSTGEIMLLSCLVYTYVCLGHGSPFFWAAVSAFSTKKVHAPFTKCGLKGNIMVILIMHFPCGSCNR